MRKFWIIFEFIVCEYVVFRNSSSLFADYATKQIQSGYGFPQWIVSVYFLFLFLWLYIDDNYRLEEKKIQDIIHKEYPSQWIFQTAIWTVIITAIFDYFVFGFLKPKYCLTWLSVIGLILFAAGSYIHIKAAMILKPSYSDYIVIFKDQNLISSGLYNRIRHPMYSGLSIMLLGTCLTFESILGLILLIVLFIPGLIYRIKVEEKILAGHFNNKYLEYKKQTKMLLDNLV
ncbi:MAG: isoprenylcysteine carboxylmethyltransferase family protein [Candidatus Coatesbacteria bacterium]|nr:isoprenylcysteine carboxylmethyltransferase family protein [Candidatus Coatesbacteria bacterium]